MKPEKLIQIPSSNQPQIITLTNPSSIKTISQGKKILYFNSSDQAVGPRKCNFDACGMEFNDKFTFDYHRAVVHNWKYNTLDLRQSNSIFPKYKCISCTNVGFDTLKGKVLL